MNLHPILVHFPVALLTVYCLLELVRFKKVLGQPYWFYIKAVLVMAGGLGALAAAFTGEMAEELIRNDAHLRAVVARHHQFAYLSIAIFGIAALCYLLEWVNRQLASMFSGNGRFMKLWREAVEIEQIILNPPFIVALAVLGLLAITITGALGGSMVYGQNTDPVVQLVYKIFF